MLIRKSILMMAVLLSPTLVFAEGGNSGGGGGDAVQTKQGWTTLDLAEPSLTASYFSMNQIAMQSKLNIRRLDECEAKIRNSQHHELFGLGFGSEIIRTFIGFSRSSVLLKPLMWTTTNLPLAELRDEGAIRLADQNSTKQLALQKEGVVVVYKPIFEKLDDESKSALYLHETLLKTVLEHFPENYQAYGTSEIRKLVQVLMSENFSAIPASVMIRFCGKNGTVLRDIDIAKVGAK